MSDSIRRVGSKSMEVEGVLMDLGSTSSKPDEERRRQQVLHIFDWLTNCTDKPQYEQVSLSAWSFARYVAHEWMCGILFQPDLPYLQFTSGDGCRALRNL